MKYYVIYKDNEFKGYTNSFEMLQKFIKSRKPLKYMIRIFKEKDLDDSILNDNKLSNYELSFYQGYGITYELPLFDYERDVLEEMLYSDITDAYASVEMFLSSLNYIKFNNEYDKSEVTKLLEEILYTMIDAFEYSEPQYDEIIDIVKYFKKFVLDKVRPE